MKSFNKLMVAGLVAVVFGAGTAQAQNVVRNSGNGTGNTINVGGGFGTNTVFNPFFEQSFHSNPGNKVTIGGGYSDPRLQGGGQPIVGGYGFPNGYQSYLGHSNPGICYAGGYQSLRNVGNGQFNNVNVGGLGSNTVRNSGNGSFNSINVQGGFGSNRVSGSGNGTGNSINVRP